MKIGIVGLPNVGKSTLFNALTKKGVPAENFPFCTIDPSVGIVAVPDRRLEQLGQFSHSKKIIPAIVEFVDIAGLVRGASQGEGLGNQFLGHIREVDVIAHVVRCFDDESIAHVHVEVNPLSDIEVINLELIIADIETVKRRLSTIDKDIKSGRREAEEEKSVLQKMLQTLVSGKLASTLLYSEKELRIVKGLHLLTVKPVLYVLNKKAGGHNLDELNDGRFTACSEYLRERGLPSVLIDAGVEDELSLVSPDDREELKRQLGAVDDGINSLITKGYELLNLITFFTTGEDETRGWTVVKGATAPKAGAVIHTDFKDTFIRADVINWKTLLEEGSYARARERGLVKTASKDYVVKDGDVIEFKI